MNGQVPVKSRQIPSGTAGAVITLDEMARLANIGMTDFNIRSLALTLVQRVQQKDYLGEACNILRFVRDNIRYVRDFYIGELLQPPNITLCFKSGDCDDKCILLASLLGSIGHRVRYIAIAQAPEEFSHVWLQDYIYGEWVDLEPTEPLDCGSRVPATGIVDTITREVP